MIGALGKHPGEYSRGKCTSCTWRCQICGHHLDSWQVLATGRRLDSGAIQAETALRRPFRIRKRLGCLVHMRRELPDAYQEKTLCTKHIEKLPSCTNLRRR